MVARVCREGGEEPLLAFAYPCHTRREVFNAFLVCVECSLGLAVAVSAPVRVAARPVDDCAGGRTRCMRCDQ